MTKTLKAIAIAALASCGLAQAAPTTIIDLFTTSQGQVLDNTIDGFVESNQVGSAGNTSIFGGYRELIVEVKDKGGVDEELNPDRNANMSVFNKKLTFNTTSQTKGTGIVRWDGLAQQTDGAALSTIDYTGLGGLFLGNVFTDSFSLVIIESDAGFKFSLEAYTNQDTWSKIEITANQHASPTTTYIPLIAFMDCGFSGGGITVACGTDGPVNFANVGALQAVIDPTGSYAALDLTLSTATVVPEPAALSLVALALLGAGAATRRRKA